MPTVTNSAASTPCEEAALAIEILIDERSRELGLSRSDLVRRCGYKNLSKGIRRLDELYAGDLQRTTSLIAGLSSALKLSAHVVQLALNDTNQQLEERTALSSKAAKITKSWSGPTQCS